MSSFLYRLGRWVAQHARIVVVGWAVVLLTGGVLAATAGGELRDEFTIPGTESQDGLDVLTTRFPEVAGGNGQIVFQAPEGARMLDYRAAVRERVRAVKDVDHVLLVTDPFDKQNLEL